MKIYCNTQADEDLEFFKSIAGTEYWVAVRDVYGDNTAWYIHISKLTPTHMTYTCVLKEDVDNAYLHTGYTEHEIDDILNDCDCIDSLGWCEVIQPVELLTYEEIYSMLLEGTHA